MEIKVEYVKSLGQSVLDSWLLEALIVNKE